MKKKIVLALMLGVGFAPALFAADRQTGQLSNSQIPQSGIGCNLAQKTLETKAGSDAEAHKTLSTSHTSK